MVVVAFLESEHCRFRRDVPGRLACDCYKWVDRYSLVLMMMMKG